MCVYMCGLMNFNSCIDLCSYHNEQDTEQFHHIPKLLPVALCHQILPSPPTLLTTDLFSISIFLLFLGYYCIYGIIGYGAFELASFIQHKALRFVHAVALVIIYFFNRWAMVHCIMQFFKIHHLEDICFFFSHPVFENYG